MPVGGDVTQFFIGLMGFLGESLRAGRLPVWNDLWGYGFPGLAESQMGVFYPAHVVLYRWLDTETAYVVSLVLHTLWGGLGNILGARRLGISSRRLGPGRDGLVDVRVFPDPPGPPVGLHDRMLDAVGVGPDVVLPRPDGTLSGRRRRFF